jgi:lipoprotein-releasing system ATP-binding protein
VLAAVGLADRASYRTNDLSGGQQQRVAIARALARRPPLVLADEPTGNLDTASSDDVFELMRRFNRELGTTFLVVTHDPRIAERCDRIIELVDGRVRSDRMR